MFVSVHPYLSAIKCLAMTDIHIFKAKQENRSKEPNSLEIELQMHQFKTLLIWYFKGKSTKHIFKKDTDTAHIHLKHIYIWQAFLTGLKMKRIKRWTGIFRQLVDWDMYCANNCSTAQGSAWSTYVCSSRQQLLVNWWRTKIVHSSCSKARGWRI